MRSGYAIGNCKCGPSPPPPPVRPLTATVQRRLRLWRSQPTGMHKLNRLPGHLRLQWPMFDRAAAATAATIAARGGSLRTLPGAVRAGV